MVVTCFDYIDSDILSGICSKRSNKCSNSITDTYSGIRFGTLSGIAADIPSGIFWHSFYLVRLRVRPGGAHCDLVFVEEEKEEERTALIN